MKAFASMGARGSLLLAVLGVVALLISACSGTVGPENDTVTSPVPVESTSTPATEGGPAATTTPSPIVDPGAEEEDVLGDELEQLLQGLTDADAAADALGGVPELQ